VNEYLLGNLLDEARYFTEQRMWLHAAQIYHRILTEHPDNIDIYAKLAAVYAGMSNTGAAERTLLAALGRDRNNSEIISALGMLFYEAGDLDHARYYFEQVLPYRLPHVHFMLGMIAMQGSEAHQAERHFLQAMELDPSFTEALYRLIDLLLRTDQPGRAISLLRKHIETSGADWRSTYLLGLSYSMAKMWADAIACLSAAAAECPDDADILCSAAEAFLETGSYGRAGELLDRALDVDGRSVRALALSGNLALRMSRKSKAKKYFKLALELEPSNLAALEGMKYFAIERNAEGGE